MAATKRRGLGARDLDVLLGPVGDEGGDAGGEDLRQIALDRIVPGKYQPRQNFDAERLEELAASIKSQTDILRLAQKLEKGAANAYIGVMPSFSNKDFAQVCGKLAADEATHWALLSQALGDTYPAAPFIFG